MTRRRHPPPPADLDDYGFSAAGRGFRVTNAELVALLGLDTISCALYMRALKPFADRNGVIHQLSYYRCLQILKPVQSPRGGPRMPTPTRRQLHRAFERLVQARLIACRWSVNERARALQISIVQRGRG